MLGLQRGIQENRPGHCWSSATSCQQCWFARCNSAGYLQEETLPETKGEKAEPSKQEEPKKKEDEDAEKEKPEEDQKKDEPNAGNFPFHLFQSDLQVVFVQ